MLVKELTSLVPEAMIVFYPKADTTIFDHSHAFLYKPYADSVRLGIWTNFGLVRRNEGLAISVNECQNSRKRNYAFSRHYKLSRDDYTADTILNAKIHSIHTSYSERKSGCSYIIVVIEDITVTDPNPQKAA